MLKYLFISGCIMHICFWCLPSYITSIRIYFNHLFLEKLFGKFGRIILLIVIKLILFDSQNLVGREYEVGEMAQWARVLAV